MWISTEVWDEMAKNNIDFLRKGERIAGLGSLLSNKWVDKTNGEEKKMLKLRILKFMDPEEMNSILMTNDLAIESIPSSNNKFQSNMTSPPAPEVESYVRRLPVNEYPDRANKWVPSSKRNDAFDNKNDDNLPF